MHRYISAEGSGVMVDVGVALAWVAMSGVSLRWLSMLDRRSVSDSREPDLCARDGELPSEDLYPLEFTPLPVGGFR